MQKATFGAGCFWGVEEVFCNIEGVTQTAVGYLGGTLEEPSYEDVCSGKTGHAEVVEVEFAPEKVRYEDLLEVFWKSHNPTTLNQQGPDIGEQYRSAIFFHSDDQQAVAETSKQAMNESGKFKAPIVTEITPTSTFYRAEEYHQRYLQKRGQTNCHI